MHANTYAHALLLIHISLLNTYTVVVDRQIKLNLFTHSSIQLSEMLKPHFAADAIILDPTSMLMVFRMLMLTLMLKQMRILLLPFSMMMYFTGHCCQYEY